MISERLKEARENAGYTLEAASSIAGVTKSTLFKYENGLIQNIPINKIEKLAKIYNIAPAYIMGWQESKTVVPKQSLSFISKSVTQSQPSISSKELEEFRQSPEFALLVDASRYLPQDDIKEVMAEAIEKMQQRQQKEIQKKLKEVEREEAKLAKKRKELKSLKKP